jgi:hypothetical protein
VREGIASESESQTLWEIMDQPIVMRTQREDFKTGRTETSEHIPIERRLDNLDWVYSSGRVADGGS